MIMDWIKKNKKLIMVNIFLIVVIMIMSFSVVNNDTCKPVIAPDEKPILQIILSPSCPHCRVAHNDIFNNLDIISDKYTLNMVYVGNVDTQELKITGVPTFILYENGIEVNRVVGFVNTTALLSELEN